MTVVLGIDVGTTATKALLIDVDAGRVVAEAERRSDLRSPHPGWAEEDPEQWWSNICDLQTELTLDDVRAVGVSGMAPCVILLDDGRSLLRPSVQQNDARATAEVAEIARELAHARVLERTGSPVTQQSVAPTLRWLARHEPDTWAATRTVCGSYDLIGGRLTGERFVEQNWALESGLFDLETGDWAQDICAAGGIDADLLPPVRSSSHVVGSVTGTAARATGLPEGTPVVAGSADHVASAFAAGLLEDGDLLVKLGGAGDILLSTDVPLFDERLYLEHHLVPGRYLPNGCMAASGSLIRWFDEQLGGGADLATLDAEAAATPPGAEGVVALPYFLGEKTPINDPHARGVFYGIHLGHTRGHLFRAVLEGISYGFRHHLDVFRERGFEPRRVRATNGGARSELWAQVTADVLGLPIELPSEHYGSALGAGFAAAIGADVIGDWGEIERFVHIGRTIEPQPGAHEASGRGYRTFRDLYPALRPLFERESNA